MAKTDLTAEYVREILDYDPETGVFIRKVRTAQCNRVGDRADKLVTNPLCYGYRDITIKAKKYRAHRIAWLYFYGTWPKQEIDHINGEPGDNRIANLRDVSGRVNKENTHKPRSHGRSGYLGVHWSSQAGKWQGRISVHGKSKHLGYFDDPAVAHQEYLEAKRRYHEGCAI
ncbi:HNH endonuclease [Stutzerimonas stutzeri]|nr:HNH endonuclease [Stutzerimonas stutzeri]